MTFSAPSFGSANAMTDATWKRYDAGGVVGTVTIDGRTHHAAAHPASPTNPARHPASAWCRDCKSDRCAGCRAALEAVGAPPPGRTYTDPKDGSRV